KVVIVNVCVYFGSRNAFVAEHFLYGAQICSAFDQMGGEAMSKSMGTYAFVEVDFFGQILDDDEDHHAGEGATPSIEKHKILVARHDCLMYADFMYAYFEVFGRFATYGDQPLFASFAFDLDEIYFKKKIGKF